MYQKTLVDCMRNGPFSQMGPVIHVLRLWTQSLSRVATTQFLDMCMSYLSTAEGIFCKMKEVLDKHNIMWDNCVVVGLDNTSVNLGRRNSIKTRIESKNPAVYVMGVSLSYCAQYNRES
jgi:hypothetical protein